MPRPRCQIEQTCTCNSAVCVAQLQQRLVLPLQMFQIHKNERPEQRRHRHLCRHHGMRTTNVPRAGTHSCPARCPQRQLEMAFPAPMASKPCVRRGKPLANRRRAQRAASDPGSARAERPSANGKHAKRTRVQYSVLPGQTTRKMRPRDDRQHGNGCKSLYAELGADVVSHLRVGRCAEMTVTPWEEGAPSGSQ